MHLDRLHQILSALQDACYDTISMVPLLLIIYMLFELIEHRYEGLLKRLITVSAPAGPLLGALVGCVPQCGFSVIAGALYTQRVITLGTLIGRWAARSRRASHGTPRC